MFFMKTDKRIIYKCKMPIANVHDIKISFLCKWRNL